MLYSKASLQVVGVASKDPFDRGLNGVRLEPDGATVAGNGRAFVAVGPVDAARVSWPDNAAEPMTPGGEGMIITREACLLAVKHIPRDKRQTLQHVQLSRVKDPTRVGLCALDSSLNPTVSASQPKRERFPDWRDVIRKARGAGRVRVCVNRGDLIQMLRCLEAASPDKGGVNPVFLEFGEAEGSDGTARGIVARCRNYDTGQHVIGAVGSYDTHGQWLQKSKWDKDVLGVSAKRKRGG